MWQTTTKCSACGGRRRRIAAALCGAWALSWPGAAFAQGSGEFAPPALAEEPSSTGDDVAPNPTAPVDAIPQEAESTPDAPPVAPPPPSPTMDDEIRRQLQAIQQQLADLQARLPESAAEPASADGGSNAAVPAPAASPLPAGRWYLGGTIGLNFDNANNTTRLLGTVIDDHRTSVSLEALTGRVVLEDKVAVGLTAGFTRSKVNGQFEASDGIQDRRDLEYRVDVGPVVRGLVRLDPAGRFYIFYDTSLRFGWGEGIQRTFMDSSSSVTTSNLYALSLGLRPGLMVFATPSFAVELGVEVLGVTTRWDRTTLDYTEKGSRVRADVDLNLNLLSLSFAFVGYFG